MVNNYEQSVNQDPRISLNKLGEYLTATKPSRRERILRDAKYPPTFQVIRYDPTRKLIQRYLSGKIGTTAALDAEIADYALSPTKTDFESRMVKSNLEAMKRFRDHAPALNFGSAVISIAPHTASGRTINGVSISIRPDLIVRVGGGNAPIRTGAIKLNISQGAVHSKESADYVGVLLRSHMEDGGGAGECDYQMCYALDVFGQKLVPSPKATVNRMKDIESGCSEIARQWDSI